MLAEHLVRRVEERDIRPDGIAVLVGSPVFGRLSGHARPVLHKRVVDVDVDRCAVALCLPVSGHVNLIPSADIVVHLIKVGWSLVRVTRPVEPPFAIE